MKTTTRYYVTPAIFPASNAQSYRQTALPAILRPTIGLPAVRTVSVRNIIMKSGLKPAPNASSPAKTVASTLITAHLATHKGTCQATRVCVILELSRIPTIHFLHVCHVIRARPAKTHHQLAFHALYFHIEP